MNRRDCGPVTNGDVSRPGHSLCDIARVLQKRGALRLRSHDLQIYAEFSEDCAYRYVWRLRWSEKGTPLLVVGLIPSYADERQDDDTVRKCVEIAARNGYSELIMLNMFAAWPTPDHRKAAICAGAKPQLLDAIRKRRVADPIGGGNHDRIGKEAQEVAKKGTVIAAWGDSGWSYHAAVLSRLGDDVQCFGTTDWTTTQGKRKKAMEGWTEGKFPRHASLRGIPPEAVKITSYSP